MSRQSRARRRRRRRRLLANTYRVEPLEIRRLLAFTFAGTAGSDTIELAYDFDNQEYRGFVNGAPVGATQDPDVLVDALGGNDSVILYYVADDTSVSVRGGSGNDRVELGNGRLADNLLGDVFIVDTVGLDELIANDSLDGTSPDRAVHFRVSLAGGLTHALYPNNAAAGGGSVHFDHLLHAISLGSSDAADTVYVDAAPEGLIVSLGGGNDKVVYGGSGHVVPDLQPATISGGDGFDDIIIDDSNAPANGRVYEASATHVMNQRTFGFENLYLDPRPAPNDPENTVRFSGGFPVGDNVFLETELNTNHVDDLFIGTPASPIDLDSQDLIFHLSNEGGFTHIYDQDADGTAAPFDFWMPSSDNRRIDKGGFRLSFGQYLPNAIIHGGSTNDTFAVSKMEGNIDISGGDGDDVLQTANRNGQLNDLDDVFRTTRFMFTGDGGNDLLNLSDSGDEINDGDQNYFVGTPGGGRVLRKGVNFPGSFVDDLVAWNASTDRINVVGDADNNVMYLVSNSGSQVTLNGSNGNDTLTNFDPTLNNGSLVNSASGGALIGGSGIDSATMDDGRDQLVNRYGFSIPGGLSYESGTNTYRFNIDASLENISLDQNDAPSTFTSLQTKHPATRLSVSGRGGNDRFFVGGADIDASGFSATTTTLLGGTGDDHITFDDQSDDHGATDADTFTFEFQRVTKDGVAIIYSGFESQAVWTSRVNTSPVLFPNTVRLHGIDMPTEVFGAAGDRDNVVELGHPTFGISQVTFGPITLNFPGVPAIVNVNDQVSSVARSYRLTATQLLLPSVVNYSGVAGLNIFAGSGDDTFNVDATAAATNAFFAGNNGNDLMSLGSGGPLAALAGRVQVRGNAGNDELFITNGPGGGFTDATLTQTTFTANGGPEHLYDTAERVRVIVNDAGSDVAVTSLNTPATIHGAAGDDRVDVGEGNLNANFTATLHVDAGAGQDLIELNDTASTEPFVGYSFDVLDGRERFLRANFPGGSTIVTSESVERRTLHGGNNGTGIRVYDALGGLRINASGGVDGIFVDDSAVPVTLSSGAGDDYLQVGEHLSTANPTVVFEQDDQLGGMSIYNGTVRVSPGAVLCNLATVRNAIGEPVIGGTLDLAGGAYLGKPGPYALPADAIRALLVRGRNGGAWNGVSPQGAINSSLAAGSSRADAVGYGLGSQVAPASIGSFAINPDDVLVRYALEGDANLDATVNLADFNRLAGNFGQPNRAWVDGDVNYDATVNLADFNALAGNFGMSATAAAAAQPAAGGTRTRDALRDLLDELS